MKKLLLAIILTGIFYLFCLVGEDNQKAFDDCMAAGVQSEDTCRFYAFQ